MTRHAPLARKALIIAAISLVGLVTVLVGARVFIATPMGASVIESQMDGRAIGSLGVVSLEGLQGDILHDFEIEHVALQDDGGVWLTIDQARIAWDPLAYLFSGVLTFELLAAEDIALVRRPPESDGGSGASLPRLRMDTIQLDRLRLAEGIVGQAVELSIVSEFQTFADGRISLVAALDRLDADGDTARVALERTGAGAINAQISANGAAGGPLAALLRAPDSVIELNTDLNGDRQSGSGDGQLTLDGQSAARFEGQWTRDGFVARGNIDGQLWSDAIVGRFIGDRAQFELSGGLADRIRLNAMSLTMSGADVTATRANEGWDVAAEIAPTRLAQWTGLEISGDQIAWQGRVVTGDALSATGLMDIENFAYQSVSAQSVSGPLNVQRVSEGFQINGALALTGAEYPDVRLATVLGPAPEIDINALWHSQDRALRISALDLAGTHANAHISGIINPGARRFDVSGNVVLDRLSDLASFEGRGESDFEATGGFDGSITISAMGRAFELSGNSAFERIGTNILFSADAARNASGLWSVDAARLEGDGIWLNWAGDLDRAGLWTGSGEAALNTALELGAVQIAGGAAIAIDLRPDNGQQIWRLEAASSALVAGPVQLTSPRLRAQGRGLTEGLNADLRFTANSPQGEIDVSGLLAGEIGAWHITDLDGVVGPASLNGEAQLAGGIPAIHLDASGELPGDGAVIGSLRITGGERVEIEAALNLSDWTNGDIALERLDLAVRGDLESLEVTATAQGTLARDWAIEINGTIRNANDGVTGSMTIHGTFGDYSIGTVTPLVLTSSDIGQTYAGEWSLGNARIVMNARYAESGNQASLRVVDLPFEMITTLRSRVRIDGVLSGELDYQLDEAGLTGNVLLQGRDLLPEGGDPGESIDTNITLALLPDGLVLNANATGADLLASAEARARTGSIFHLSDILDRMNAPVSGSASLDGPIGTLAGFHLPESQTLAGHVVADIVLDGLLGTPNFSGDLEFSEGSFRDIRKGIYVQDVAASGHFVGDGATLDQLTASDGDRGQLTGSGRLSLADAQTDGAFDIQFRNFRAVDQRNLTAMVTGDANIALSSGGRVHITGAAQIDEVEARPPESGRAPIVEIEVREINRPANLAPAPFSRPSRITMDYDVTAPGRIFVRAPSLESEWALDLTVLGPISTLKLNGEANLVRGSASLVGRPFQLESGIVRFRGLPDEARIAIDARRRTDDLTALVQITGPVTAPRITVSSEPAFPDDEVLSRILFGRSVSELSPLEAAQLAAALSSAATGRGGFDVFDRLRNAVGVDRLSFRTGASGAPIVTGGRYIDENVYLQIEAGSGSDGATAARIEWELQPNLRLLSRVSGAAEASIALRWRREFD